MTPQPQDGAAPMQNNTKQDNSVQTSSVPATGRGPARRPLLVRASVGAAAVGLCATLAACGSSSTSSSASPSGLASATAVASGTPTASSSASASTSASATPSAKATPTVKPTVVKNLDALTVTPTTVGKTPKVTAKWPLAITSTQVKVLTPGTGAAVAKGGVVEVNYQGVNARNGKVFDQSFGKTSATFSLAQVVPGFTKAIEGQKVGSRVLVMMTAADGYADGQPSVGILKGDNLVFVIDILSTPLTKPQGTAVAPRAGLPTVTSDAKGVPTVAIPKTAAPTGLVVQPLIKGTGKKVAATDAITVNYRAYDWATGKLVQDSYPTGAQSGLLSSTVTAWQKALVGQSVGSRLLVVAPPSEAYGSAGMSPIPANSTVVYVIDILYTQAGAAG